MRLTIDDEIPNFASNNHADRKRWAERIIELHHGRIEDLPARKERLTADGMPALQLAHFDTRLVATRNSLKSWLTYREEDYPRRSGAPAIRPLYKYV